MKNTYSIGLKVIVLLVALLLLHTVGNILGSAGLLSDLFIVLGAYQFWLNVKNSEARRKALNKINSFVDVEDLAEVLSKQTEAIKEEVKKVKSTTDLDFHKTFFKSNTDAVNFPKENTTGFTNARSVESSVRPLEESQLNQLDTKTYTNGSGI